ncbi:hypothetical protein SOASR015_04080 [Pectobacterium carotovorum subsp. carotovorum]|nr:hypothetical protein SOASR015_04080 [Pectobacterium carotovorum subsp. carotovorum]GLX54734.1 hypothetical protein Pcaca02_00430 [Pectobacterium carotovorum subsp. carotovorum]
MLVSSGLDNTMNNLEGTFQTLNTSCEEWGRDIGALSVIHRTESDALQKYSFSNYPLNNSSFRQAASEGQISRERI